MLTIAKCSANTNRQHTFQTLLMYLTLLLGQKVKSRHIFTLIYIVINRRRQGGPSGMCSSPRSGQCCHSHQPFFHLEQPGSIMSRNITLNYIQQAGTHRGGHVEFGLLEQLLLIVCQRVICCISASQGKALVLVVNSGPFHILHHRPQM